VIVRIRDLTADGKVVADREVTSYRGRVDPAAPAVDEGDSVVVGTYVDPSGRLLFVGHSVRVPPVWKIGLDVVDVRSGRLLQSIRLDTQPSSTAAGPGPAASGAAPTPNGGSGSTGRFAWAPTVTFSPDGRHVLIQATVANQNQIEETAYWTASLRSGSLGSVSRLPWGSGTLADEDCRENQGAFGDADTLYSLCVNQSSGYKTIVRRIALDGSFISDSDISSLFAGRYVSGQMLSRQQHALYLWDPFGWTIARVDLGTGAVTSKVIDKAAISGSAATSDPLACLGRTLGGWIAPSAAAKVWLEPSIAISPDGSRLYLLTVNGRDFTDPSGGSAGVLVLDPRTLELVGHWQPLADLVSIKASADGRFVYASGMSGVDAHGQETNQPASVTAYDAKTGKVAAFAGQLGNGWVMFDSGAAR